MKLISVTLSKRREDALKESWICIQETFVWTKSLPIMKNANKNNSFFLEGPTLGLYLPPFRMVYIVIIPFLYMSMQSYSLILFSSSELVWYQYLLSWESLYSIVQIYCSHIQV